MVRFSARVLACVVVLLFPFGSATAATIIFDNTSLHIGGTLTFGTAASPAPALLTAGVIDLVTRWPGGLSFPVASAAGSNCGSPTNGFGCLSLTTGSFVSESTSLGTTTYTYNGGGSLAINGTAGGASGLLFSAAGFAGPVTIQYNLASGLAALSGSLNAGTLHSTLAAALGVQPSTPGGTGQTSAFELEFTVTQARTGLASTNSVQLGDVTQVPVTPIPEPASLVLVGVGLIFSRRYMKRP